MNAISIGLLFVGIVILALAVIGLAIWIAILSGRVRRLTDIIMGDAQIPELIEELELPQEAPCPPDETDEAPEETCEPRETPSEEIIHDESAVAAEQPAAAPAPAYTPAPAYSSAPVQPVQSAPHAQPDASGPFHAHPQPAQNPQFHPYAPAAQSIPFERAAHMEPQAAPSASHPRSDYGNGALYQNANYERHDGAPYEPYAEDAFFEDYRAMHTPGNTTSFGRPTPTIPFGADKDAIKRRESYTEQAMSSSFDLDSVDFSRVAGYKRRPPQAPL